MAFEDYRKLIQEAILGRQIDDIPFTLSEVVGVDWPLGEDPRNFGKWFRAQVSEQNFEGVDDIFIPKGKSFVVRYIRVAVAGQSVNDFVRLPRDLIEWMDAERGEVSRSDFIRQALENQRR